MEGHRELAEKSQLGSMTEMERAELEELVMANDPLTILHAKATLSLKHDAVDSVHPA